MNERDFPRQRSPVPRRRSAPPPQAGGDGTAHPSGRAGLLLPQVAAEYGWDRDTFLRQTCLKAGLPGDAWRAEGTRIERFSAEVFGE